MPRGLRLAVARVTQTKFTVSAAGIITNDAGDVLLLNHILRPESGWGVPGGFVGGGEQAEDGLRREIREETGIELKNVQLYRIRTRLRHIEMFFLAEGVGTASVLSREISELGWFAIDKMPAEMSLDQQFLVRKALGVD